ncbi:MAG: hypothetical protein SFZ03_01105 [Candidatus Melainabacteria bacterium]|nr:hypothetical protein [Candidatus Melainabacteria bacterium]
MLVRSGLFDLPDSYQQCQIETLKRFPLTVYRVLWKAPGAPEALSIIVKSVPSETVPQWIEPLFATDAFTVESALARLMQEQHYLRVAEQVQPDSAWAPKLIFQDEPLRCLVQTDPKPRNTLETNARRGLVFTPSQLSALGQKLGSFHTESRRWTQNFSSHPQANAIRVAEYTDPISRPDAIRQAWQQQGFPDAWRDLQERFLARHGDVLRATLPLLEQITTDADPVVLHGQLTGADIFMGAGPQITVVNAGLSQPGAAWWDPGVLVAHLHCLSTLAHAGYEYAVPFLSGYLSGLEKPLANARMYPFLRNVYRVAGLELIRQILGVSPLAYLANVYLKETLLKRAVEMIQNPQALDDYRALVQ